MLREGGRDSSSLQWRYFCISQICLITPPLGLQICSDSTVKIRARMSSQSPTTGRFHSTKRFPDRSSYSGIPGKRPLGGRLRSHTACGSFPVRTLSGLRPTASSARALYCHCFGLLLCLGLVKMNLRSCLMIPPLDPTVPQKEYTHVKLEHCSFRNARNHVWGELKAKGLLSQNLGKGRGAYKWHHIYISLQLRQQKGLFQ